MCAGYFFLGGGGGVIKLQGKDSACLETAILDQVEVDGVSFTDCRSQCQCIRYGWSFNGISKMYAFVCELCTVWSTFMQQVKR